MKINETYISRSISFGILLLKVLTIYEILLIINQRKLYRIVQEERNEMSYNCLDYKT